MSTVRRTTRLLALLGAALLSALALAAPAGAHGATGTMGIEVTPGTAPLTAKVRVLLEYANDREVVLGAAVTATAAGPSGQTVGPTPLADQGKGVYEGTLTMPAEGSWTVTVTAADPSATATAAVTLLRSTFTLVPDTASPTTTGDVRISADRAARTDRPSDDEGGTNTAVIVGGAIAVVLVVAAGVVGLVVRRRRA